MKQPVYADTDIILDVLARRTPFYQSAARLFSLAELGEVKIYVSALSFANLHYILRKNLSAHKAVETLRNLRKLVSVLPLDDSIIARALDAGFRDFEDAIQYNTALSKGVAYLITRNVRDYPKPSLTVCTAEEFLAHHSGTELS
ncbi:MAG: PIN domain-containing protein [Nitrospirae bacterium]|nr:PIN domain-containing protein [Nitrospirota bacterium]